MFHCVGVVNDIVDVIIIIFHVLQARLKHGFEFTVLEQNILFSQLFFIQVNKSKCKINSHYHKHIKMHIYS